MSAEGAPLRIGVVGCGAIAATYLRNAPHFPGLRYVACADLRAEAAAAAAQTHGLQARGIDELLASDDIDAVLNLTVPAAHAPVALAAIAHGKHVYLEKPLATTLDDGLRIVQAASAGSLRVGCAPDTVLGAGVQHARALLDGGAIGRVITGSAAVLSHGMEHFHPDPAFFYREGGGPVFDRAPYELTALVTLLGPLAWVLASGQIGQATRTISAPASPRRGETFAVEVMTTVQGVLGFASGAQISFLGSWDAWRSELPLMELHGSEGSMRLPDANWFGGDVLTSRAGAPWQTHGTAAAPAGRPNFRRQNGEGAANYRGLGLAEMAQAIAEGRPHRAGADLALHVLAAMQALHQAARDGRRVDVGPACARPEALADAQAATLLRAG